MGDQRIDEGTVDVACARMHDEPCGLVHDNDRVVLIDHVERDRLGLRLRAHRRWHADLEAVARFDRVFHVLYGRAAERYVPLPDQGLHAGAAQLREAIAQEAVEPEARVALIGFCR